jgi:hypothetical protein
MPCIAQITADLQRYGLLSLPSGIEPDPNCLLIVKNRAIQPIPSLLWIGTIFAVEE